MLIMNINCIPIHTIFPLGNKTVLHYWYFHTFCAGEILLWRFLLTLFSSCKSNKKTWWITKGEWAHREQQWRQQTTVSPSPAVLNIKLHELHNTRRKGTTRSCHDVGGNWVMVTSSYNTEILNTQAMIVSVIFVWYVTVTQSLLQDMCCCTSYTVGYKTWPIQVRKTL